MLPTVGRSAYTPSVEALVLLEGVLSKVGGLMAGVRREQAKSATPCPDFDVSGLLDHMVGWMQVFAAGANNRAFDGDPSAYRCGADPAEEFAAASKDVVAGWRRHGFDRSVRLVSGETPGQMAFNMTVMEYLTHGWDLAKATGQAVPFTDEEATETLNRAETTLPAQYRGEGMPFGEIIPVPDDAAPIDRLAGFMGRRP